MDKVIEMSTGVELKLVKVPLFVFDRIKKDMSKLKPKVPTYYIESKGREEPNPNDETYIEEMASYNFDVGLRLTNAMIALGTIINVIPETMEGPDLTGWSDRLDAIGVEVHTQKDSRYVDWVKYYAAPAAEDIQVLMMECCRFAGVPEKDVADSLDFFRGQTK